MLLSRQDVVCVNCDHVNTQAIKQAEYELKAAFFLSGGVCMLLYVSRVLYSERTEMTVLHGSLQQEGC